MMTLPQTGASWFVWTEAPGAISPSGDQRFPPMLTVTCDNVRHTTITALWTSADTGECQKLNTDGCCYLTVLLL